MPSTGNCRSFYPAKVFVDETRVFVASGKGGDGAVSFHREKYKPKGGPDGGDGGRGGSIVFVADVQMASLVRLRDHPHQRAASGGKGARNNRTGADAPDLILPVPAGCLIKDSDGRVLADLARAGDRIEISKGGRGGRGNTAFKSSTYRVPGFAELGEPSREMWLSLELRLIADVAVIGLPNAGKSTLVAALSAARPKVAGYPFTTLEPSLGVVEHGDERFTICDIPGLIEGAHLGKGLGVKFLRHTARSLAFLHMIDSTAGKEATADYLTIRNELASYDPALTERPDIVVLNKIDAVDPEVVEEAAAGLRAEGIETVAVSALEGSGLESLLDRLATVVQSGREDAGESEGFMLYRTVGDSLSVVPEDGGNRERAWRITGEAPNRWAAMTDMNNPEAVGYLQSRLEKAGSEKALAEAGARPGDDVRIGEAVFEWWPPGTAPD